MIRGRRAEVLRMAYELGVEHGRPPYPSELARRAGTGAISMRRLIKRAVRDGQLQAGGRSCTFHGLPLRLTPRAIIGIGLAPLVYLAWPMQAEWTPEDGEIGRDIAARLAWRTGIAPVSPYLASAGDRDGMHAAAVALAARVDAVVVYRDELLLGRADVRAALCRSLPVSVLRPEQEAAIQTAADLWDPPLIVPDGPQGD